MNQSLMFWNLQKAVVKTFVRFSVEILMVLESAGGCCESIINVLEYPEGCCENICTSPDLYFRMALLFQTTVMIITHTHTDS